MKRKKSEWLKVEQSRELRQWIGLAVKTGIGVIAGAVYLDNHPEIKQKIDCGIYEIKKKVHKTFCKEN